MTRGNKHTFEGIIMNIFLTGSAGFIGFHTSKSLLDRGHKVVGYDIIGDYYDPSIKKDRLKILEAYDDFKFIRGGLEDKEKLNMTFNNHDFDKVVNLAAQPGVRYSLENPDAYVVSNMVGFYNILEACRNNGVDDLIYASSSSVYGGNEKIPFSTTDNVDRPLSLYAATKISNELTAHVYSHLFGINATGLRLFTVYGPWGRPDMAMFKFTDQIIKGKPIDVYNYGKMERDFTYVDDIVDGIVKAINMPFRYEIFNLGNNRPQTLEYFISLVEENLGMKAKINYLPLQPSEVKLTYADIDRSKEVLGYKPKTTLEDGVKKFIDWYLDYYEI